MKFTPLYTLQIISLLSPIRCIPKYWKTKSMSNLSDLKKQEANGLNLRVYQALSTKYQNVLSLNSQEESGLNVIELGAVIQIVDFCFFTLNEIIFEFIPLRDYPKKP